MSKTIPIWAVVMNKIIAQVYGVRSLGPSWDTSLHTPIWVAESEKNQIEARLDSWVSSFFALGDSMKGLVPKLDKPLRPLWICPSSTLTELSPAESEQLNFCPIVLVSCSNGGQAGARRSSGDQNRSGWPYVYVPGTFHLQIS